MIYEHSHISIMHIHTIRSSDFSLPPVALLTSSLPVSSISGADVSANGKSSLSSSSTVAAFTSSHTASFVGDANVGSDGGNEETVTGTETVWTKIGQYKSKQIKKVHIQFHPVILFEKCS